jgi:hypothetical protein
MLRSDEIIQNASGRGLSRKERQELVEAYRWEQDQDKKTQSILSNSVRDFKESDGLNLPRHIINGKCVDFVECQIDHKCHNYNSSYIKCQNCVLHETDGICKKKHIHNEKTFAMMIKRGRVNLDG